MSARGRYDEISNTGSGSLGFMCRRCGVLVVDKDRHDDWHGEVDPEDEACSECEGSGWVRLIGNGDPSSPAGSVPATNPGGEHTGACPCLPCNGTGVAS